jgi:hypothetical protein
MKLVAGLMEKPSREHFKQKVFFKNLNLHISYGILGVQ